MKEKIKLEFEGYETLLKTAVKTGNGSCVFVPKKWVGKKVRVILIEKLDEVQ